MEKEESILIAVAKRANQLLLDAMDNKDLPMGERIAAAKGVLHDYTLQNSII